MTPWAYLKNWEHFWSLLPKSDILVLWAFWALWSFKFWELLSVKHFHFISFKWIWIYQKVLNSYLFRLEEDPDNLYNAPAISVGGRSRQFVQCTRYVYSPSGKRFPCSFKKRKDSIAKTGDLTHILDHRCFNQNIDQYLQNSIKKNKWWLTTKIIDSKSCQICWFLFAKMWHNKSRILNQKWSNKMWLQACFFNAQCQCRT